MATTTLTMRKMRRKHKLLLILFSLLMMGLLKTGFVFFVIGMMPCVVAYYMDVSKHRYMFKSVFNANLAGMMPSIVKMIHAGPSSVLLQEIMGNSTNWFIIYGAAFMGWLLVKVCPMVAQVMVMGLHQSQVARYEGLQRKIETEWGPEVTQFSGDKRPV
ncbi:MAG: hypothetical protein V4735_01385 [Pseudomonadota bacterium]